MCFGPDFFAFLTLLECNFRPQGFVAHEAEMVFQSGPNSALIQIRSCDYMLVVFGLFDGANKLQMTRKRACWKAYFLSFKGVMCSGNYPFWISFHKLYKTGLLH